MVKTKTILYFSAFCSAFTPSRSSDDHALHDHSKRAVPSVHLTPPTRDLEWGDINVIHTTDTHGWLLGHQEPSLPEPNYRYQKPSLINCTWLLINLHFKQWRLRRPGIIRHAHEADCFGTVITVVIWSTALTSHISGTGY